MLRDRRGFTIIEVVVVMVILSIILAIAVPSLHGFIEQKKERVAVSEGQKVMTAVQVLASRAYSDQASPTVGSIERAVVGSSGAPVSEDGVIAEGGAAHQLIGKQETGIIEEFTVSDTGQVVGFVYQAVNQIKVGLTSSGALSAI